MKQQSYAVVEIILKFIASEDRCLLNEKDTFNLMDYQSALVPDAINTVFSKSVFNDRAPVTGVIKGGKETIYFESDISPNLNYDQAKALSLE